MSDITVIEHDAADYEYDPKPSEEDGVSREDRVAVIRTSDRISFRRCRRRWGWSSHLRGNRGPLETPAPLWTGVGFHYAMEDFHGLKTWPSAKAAFDAFVTATYRKDRISLPSNWQEQKELAESMLNYYERIWLSNRDPLQTFIYQGKPQVEVNFRIEIPWERGKYGFDRVIYSGTLDRIVIDELGRLWILDYKTAKMIQTLHFANDPQISAYCWAGSFLYPGMKIEGFIYQQHRKAIPEAPPFLASGRISTASTLKTTRGLYRSALVNLYGSVDAAPLPNVDYLNTLSKKEDQDKDLFVQRNRIHRNDHQNQSEGVKLLMEAEDMLNPDLPLYPSPSRDCAFLCPFSSPCVSMDDGSDWEYEMDAMTIQREGSYDLWRQYLPHPQERPRLEAVLPQQK